MIDVVVGAGAKLGECPVWSAPEAALYWVDIDGQAIHRYDPVRDADETRATTGRPGSIALTATPGRLLVAMEHEVGWFDWDAGEFTPWVELEREPGNRLNDGRCDPAGRFWVGSMYADTRAGRFTGRLHVVEPTGTATTTQTGVGVSNGLAFSPDGATMYWADTKRDTVWAFDYDPGTGRASGQRVFVDFAGLPGHPDGACVDAAGCYWVACVHGGAVARITPAGEVDRLVELPASRPTMPAFGGPDLATLYVTTIGAGGSRRPAEPDPAAGCVLALDPQVAGLPEPVFAGPA